MYGLCQRETDAVKDETELEQLMKLLHEPLPVSFRLNLHRPDADRFVYLFYYNFNNQQILRANKYFIFTVG